MTIPESSLNQTQQRTKQVSEDSALLLNILDTLPVMVCLLTPDHHVIFANHAFRQKFGEPAGRHCYDFCFGYDNACSFCESFIPLQTGKPHHWEVVSPDGNTIIDAYDFPFADSDGSPLILEMDIDITERKRSELTFNERESLLRAVTENNPDPIFMKDLNCRLLFANPATLQLIGKTIEEVIGKTDEEYYDHPEDGRAIMANDKRIMESGKSEVVEETLSNPDGSKRYFLSSKAPQFNNQGKVIGLVGVAHDITERKKTEETIHYQAQHLAKRNADLEYMNDLMTGRELRMVELKKEIDMLCRQFGAPTRYGY